MGANSSNAAKGVSSSAAAVAAGASVSVPDSGNASGETKPKCKACCACPETKRARDACIVENGEENCTKLIEEHKECMRKMGFNI